ncbi:MAG: penicillin acylase family protein [Planctomycetota bacterium]|nr:penicillin acylase family protein [Planctomycetota bacterium]
MCGLPALADESTADNSQALATAVTIHRDEWGVAHILGPTDESVIFGMGFVQAEDNFWQLEDTTIRALGRYAEVTGEAELPGDLLNRAFRVVGRSKADFEKLSPEFQRLISAFVKGVNWYLKHHPQTPQRLKLQWEPWMILAIDRHMLLDFTYGGTHAGRPRELFSAANTDAVERVVSPLEQAARDAIGSNEWAIGPSRTAAGNAMLLINPHQPWYGWGQFYEAHLHSEETIQFSGACFFGTPIPTVGHNENLGWTYTVNSPDNADAWKVVFDKPDEPLAYRFDKGHRMAIEWIESIGVRTGGEVEQREITFRRTHHGPVVRRLDDTTFLAANVAGIFDLRRLAQAAGMVRAKNLLEWKQAVGNCALPMFNVAYADREGNILYLYNGSIPIRDPSFDWTKPVDGSTSATAWRGIHPLKDLPQVLNPKCGYVQNCNTSPFLTTHDENPDRSRFPAYMFEDADFRKRRAQLSRMILRETEGLTFEQMSQLAFDTRMYWPLKQLGRYDEALKKYATTDPDAAGRIRPLLDHLLDWDCRSSNESTQASLCVYWYEELHEGMYPGETFKQKYAGSIERQLDALLEAASQLKRLHGDWKVPWGKVHRIQRVPDKADVMQAAQSFNGLFSSLPCPGVPGPLGVVYTVYSVPGIRFIRPARYAVVGSCYVGVVEFGDRIRASSAVQFGTSGDPRSKHFVDQARLFSESRLKPAWFYPEDVRAHAVRAYHPGRESDH